MGFTLAHLPCYNLRKEAISYLDQQKINFQDAQTFFPNTAALSEIDLSDDARNFDNFDGRKTFVFYSNVFNVDDKTNDLLENNKAYRSTKHFEKSGVFITIYKKVTSN